MRQHELFREYQLALLPVALATILVLTCIPLELRGAAEWRTGINYRDFVENWLLYVPLGVALGSRRLWFAMAVSLTLSIAAEVIQIWSVERYPATSDVVANALGGLTGSLAWRVMSDRNRSSLGQLQITRRRAIASIGGIILVLGAWSLPMQASSLDGWTTDYSLLLGNELTGDRPWQGMISAAAVSPKALSSSEVRELYRGVSIPAAAAAHSANTAPFELTQLLREPVTFRGGRAVVADASISQEFGSRAKHNGGFSVVVRATPANIEQEGPARLVSFSVDTRNRNFDLGQEESRLTFRVQTAVNEPHLPTRFSTGPVLGAGKERFIVATFDGAIARIYVDSMAVARVNIAASGCLASLLCDQGIVPMLGALGALAAVLALASLPWQHRWHALSISLLAGAGLVVLLQGSHLGPTTLFSGWIQIATIIGAGGVGIAAATARPKEPTAT